MKEEAYEERRNLTHVHTLFCDARTAQGVHILRPANSAPLGFFAKAVVTPGYGVRCYLQRVWRDVWRFRTQRLTCERKS